MPTDRTPKRRRRFAFTLVELLVVIAIIGILVALLLPAVQAAREAARRAQCQSNMKNVALAVLNYESTNGEFPPAISSDQPISALGSHTRYRSGWLVETLPYMEEQPLYDQFDFDQIMLGGNFGETSRANYTNILARGTDVGVLKCPSDANNETPFTPASRGSIMGDNWARGNYAGNAGPGNWLSGGESSASSPVAPIVMVDGEASNAWKGGAPLVRWPSSIRGVFGPNATVRIAQIVDGTSKTMMLSEIRAGVVPEDWRGAWAFPFPGGNLVARHGSGGDANGPNNCHNRSDDQIGNWTGLTCRDIGTTAGSDGDPLVAECMTCNNDFAFAQASSRSVHPGGLFVAHVDGSVAFITDDIETTGAGGACCAAWDYLILAADEGFVFRSFR